MTKGFDVFVINGHCCIQQGLFKHLPGPYYIGWDVMNVRYFKDWEM